MTEKLFYKDSHLKTFTATVCSCEPYEEKYKAVLDRTAFFPEGGGQSSDTGKINGVPVVDVQEKGGIIYHVVDAFLEPGTEVTGTINWERRFSKMQQHTAEHIISGLIHKKYGYNNVGFHLAETYCTLDLDGPLSKEQLKEMENLVNQAVFANVPIEVLYPTEEELKTLDYRSKIEIEGQVRLVHIPGCDLCACCAPHVKKTGEVGLVKFVQSQNYKGGIRITMMSGERALADYQRKEESIKAIMFSLASKEELVAESVENLKSENASLKAKIVELQRQILKMKVETIAAEDAMICLFEAEMESVTQRELMNLVLDKGAQICGVFVGTDDTGYRYVIGSQKLDVRNLSKNLNLAFEGRGGGKPEMTQGSLKGQHIAIQQMFYDEAVKCGK